MPIDIVVKPRVGIEVETGGGALPGFGALEWWALLALAVVALLVVVGARRKRSS